MPPQRNAPVSATISAPAVPAAGSIRLGPFAGVPAVLQEAGVHPGPVLAAVGLSPQAMSDQNLIVPYATIGRLFRQCAELTGQDHFGLLVGARVSVGSMGLLGFVMQSAKDVRTALQDMVHFRALNDRGALVTLESDADSISLAYSVLDAEIPGLGQIYDCAAAVGCSVLRQLCGPRWNPGRVRLPRTRPRNIAPYRTFFRSRLEFDAPHAELIFHRRWLAAQPGRADPLLYQHLSREVRELHERSVETTETLAPMLRSLLRSQHCRQDAIAAQLGLDRRTLSRRLLAEGTTYRNELAAVRYEEARELLADSSRRTAEIAARLGYADVSAFSHAFKRWSGVSPAEWRRHCGLRE